LQPSINAKLSAVIFLILLTFSGGRGKGVALLKPSSKRKRTRAEVEEVKDEETQLKLNPQLFFQQSKRLKNDYAQLENEVVQLRQVAGVQQRLGPIDIN
jgi:hypothetical protein